MYRAVWLYARSYRQLWLPVKTLFDAPTVTELAKGVKELAEANGGVKTEDFTKLNDTVDELSKGVVELGKTDVAALLKEQSDKSDKIITELEKRVKELEDLPEAQRRRIILRKFIEIADSDRETLRSNNAVIAEDSVRASVICSNVQKVCWYAFVDDRALDGL